MPFLVPGLQGRQEMGSERMRRVRPEVIVVIVAVVCIVASVAVGAVAYLHRQNSAPTSPPAAVGTDTVQTDAQLYEFSTADLEGLISGLGDVAVLQGAENVDLLSLVTYDNTVITGAELDTGLLSFANQGQVSVTYTITADAGALAQHLGVNNAAQASGPVTLTSTAQVYVISQAEAWDFQTSHPDVTIYSSDNTPYTPQPTEEVPLEEETPEEAEPPEENPEEEPEHTHNWQPVYTTVHHNEEGHYETQTVSEAYDEPVYESMEVCSACGAAYAPGSGMDMHILEAHGGLASYSTQQVQTGTVHHDAETKEVWVVDRAAYDERVVTGYRCSCGATR